MDNGDGVNTLWLACCLHVQFPFWWPFWEHEVQVTKDNTVELRLVDAWVEDKFSVDRNKSTPDNWLSFIRDFGVLNGDGELNRSCSIFSWEPWHRKWWMSKNETMTSYKKWNNFVSLHQIYGKLRWVCPFCVSLHSNKSWA